MLQSKFAQRSAALMLVLAGWMTGETPSRAADIDKYVPDDAMGIVTIQWDKVIVSKPARALLGNKTPFQFIRDLIISQTPGAAEVINSPDLARVIEYLSAHTHRLTTVVGMDGGGFLEGKYDHEQLLKLVKAAALAAKMDLKTEKVGTNELVSLLPGDFGPAFALIDNDSLIIVGTRGTLFHLLGGKEEHPQSQPEDKLREAREAALKAFPKRKKELLEALHQVMKEGEIAFAGATPDMPKISTGYVKLDDAFFFHLDLEFAGDAMAAQMGAAARAGIGEMIAELHRSPAAKVLKSIVLRQQGSRLTIELKVPAEQVGPTLAAMMNPPSDIEPAAVFELPDESNPQLAFSNDGKLLAAASTSSGTATKGTIRIWNIATRKLEFEQDLGNDDKGKPIGALSVSFHPNNKWIAVGNASPDNPAHRVAVWDIQLHKKIKEFDGDAGMFSPDGKLFAYITATGVKLITSATWQVVREIPEPRMVKIAWNGGAQHLLAGFSEDGARLFAITAAGGADIFEVATGAAVASVEAKDLNVDNGPFDIQEAILTDQGAFLEVAGNGTVVVFNLEKHAAVQRRQFMDMGYIVIASGGNKLASPQWNMLRLRELSSQEVQFLRSGPGSYFGGVAVFSPSGEYLAAGAHASGAEGKIMVWPLK